MNSLSNTYIGQELLARRARLASLSSTAASPDLTRLLDDVDRALDGIARETYGVCETCHEPVERERLLANPLTRFCLDCLDLTQRQALQRDLDSAALVQSSLLPPNDFQFPGYEVDYHYEPLGPVSGDYCDLIASDQGLYFFFGDVAGKGVAASLLMAQLHALFRSLVRKGQPLGEMVADANNLFSSSTLPHSYATLLAGRIGPEGSVEICNAGHLPPQIVSKQGIDVLASGSLPFGLFPSVRFDPSALTLERGDALFLYTDGFSEAPDSRGQEYGSARLRDSLGTTRGHSASATLQHSLRKLSDYRNGTPLSDDLTAMVIRRL